MNVFIAGSQTGCLQVEVVAKLRVSQSYQKVAMEVFSKTWEWCWWKASFQFPCLPKNTEYPCFQINNSVDISIDAWETSLGIVCGERHLFKVQFVTESWLLQKCKEVRFIFFPTQSDFIIHLEQRHNDYWLGGNKRQTLNYVPKKTSKYVDDDDCGGRWEFTILSYSVVFTASTLKVMMKK